MDLLSYRLAAQRLLGEKFSSPEEAVSFLGAVQAQDFSGAKWSVGIRVTHATNATLEDAYNKGKILRTHVLRPTWHFISPEDIKSFLALSAPQVKKLTAYYNRQAGLTEEILKKTNTIITKALSGENFLTRQEIKLLLEKEGIPTDAQRLGHIVHRAEIEGLITSGPLRAKQFTYALLDERIPQGKILGRDEALARLAEKYFLSHGPALVKDFAWWSGLSGKDATEGLFMISSKLEKETIKNKTYWFSRQHASQQKSRQNVFLVSVYDEYFIGYADRSDLYSLQHKENLPIGNALLTSLMIVNGKVAGTWKRTQEKGGVQITLFPFEPLTSMQIGVIDEIVDAYGTFFRTNIVWK